MEKENGVGMVKVDTTGKTFFWFLMLVGVILIAYFTINLVINAIYAVDLAGDGVSVVQKEAVVENGQVIEQPEVLVLHGVTGWVENFSPWLAVNTYVLALGAIFLGLGYVMILKKEDKVAVSLYKMRLLGGYFMVVAALMLGLGMDRVFFIPHGHKPTVLTWTNWYILEFLAHLIWAVVLAVLSFFYLRVRRIDGGEDRE
jgi:hypothetical protein